MSVKWVFFTYLHTGKSFVRISIPNIIWRRKSLLLFIFGCCIHFLQRPPLTFPYYFWSPFCLELHVSLCSLNLCALCPPKLLQFVPEHLSSHLGSLQMFINPIAKWGWPLYTQNHQEASEPVSSPCRHQSSVEIFAIMEKQCFKIRLQLFLDPFILTSENSQEHWLMFTWLSSNDLK